jgi:hypothetical protein
LDLGKTSLGTSYLCSGDPCVQISFHFVPLSSRIKVNKEKFGLEEDMCTVLGRSNYSGFISGQVRKCFGQTSLGLERTIPDWIF